MTLSQRKVCVVVNSRANYGRIKSFLRAASDHPGLELQLVVGASALLHRFGKAIDIIRADGFEPQAVVHSIVDGETPVTMAKSVGLGCIELATHFEALKPDVVLTVADERRWRATLARYPDVIAAQGVASLAAHDRWYCEELPAAIRSREQPHVTIDELVRVTEWKMARGIWRARNLALVKANQKANVVEVPSQQEPGTVVAQNPAAGSQLQQGSTVRLNVARQIEQPPATTETTPTETTPTTPTTPTTTG